MIQGPFLDSSDEYFVWEYAVFAQELPKARQKMKHYREIVLSMLYKSNHCMSWWKTFIAAVKIILSYLCKSLLTYDVHNMFMIFMITKSGQKMFHNLIKSKILCVVMW